MNDNLWKQVLNELPTHKHEKTWAKFAGVVVAGTAIQTVLTTGNIINKTGSLISHILNDEAGQLERTEHALIKEAQRLKANLHYSPIEEFYPQIIGYYGAASPAPAPPIFNSFMDYIIPVYEQLLELTELPEPNTALLNPLERARYRDALRVYIGRFSDRELVLKRVMIAMLQSLMQFTQTLPKHLTMTWPELKRLDDLPEQAGFKIPLTDALPDLPDSILAVISPYFDDDLLELNLFAGLRETLDRNYRDVAEKLTGKRDSPFEAKDHPGPPDRLAFDFLRNTTFLSLYKTQTHFQIPAVVRPEHILVIAASGTGKTQLIQHDVYEQLQQPDGPGIVVIDSQGQMLEKLEWLECAKHRLIIVDPADPVSPALNMFALPQRLQSYDRNTRESIESNTLQLFNFIFAALDQSLTGRQSTFFSFTVRLMFTIPGATIRTLREVLEEKNITASNFAPYIDKLDDDAKAFFKNQFNTAGLNTQTKQQIVQRLYGIMRVPAFNRMFGSGENRLDLFSALNDGKLILFNTNKQLLGDEASSTFGRYAIALTISAAFQRIALAGEHRLALLYVDEAKEYFNDGTLDSLLTQVRKYNMGALIAFQNLDQLPPVLRPVVIANTATKLVAGLTASDARALSGEMRQPADWLLSLRKHADGSEFGCYIRNRTDKAVRLTIPFLTVEKATKMTAVEHDAMRAANSAKLGTREGLTEAETAHEEVIATVETDPAGTPPQTWEKF